MITNGGFVKTMAIILHNKVPPKEQGQRGEVLLFRSCNNWDANFRNPDYFHKLQTITKINSIGNIIRFNFYSRNPKVEK